jgi:medium-chain acyl-[acyl-carrier-protein] hydrolase
VELPGRGRLFKQPFADSLEALAETIREGITPYTASPYAIFGHSMGALLAYEVTAQLRSAGHPEPSALFLSGRCPPFGDRTGISVSRLPDPQLLEHLRKLAGTPQEILASEELMQIFLPVLRSDFSLCEEYEPQEAQLFTMPVTVMSGDEDEETSEREMQRWRCVTMGTFTSRRYRGDHFFMKSPLVMQDVYGDLERLFLKAEVGSPHG